MGVFDGMQCEHLGLHFGENDRVAPLVALPVIRVRQVRPGVKGRCLASAAEGGRCDHDCKAVVVIRGMLTGVNFKPIETAVIGGKPCGARPRVLG